MSLTEQVLWPIIGLATVTVSAFELRGHRPPSWISVLTLVVALVVRAALEGLGSVDAGLGSGLLGALGCAVPFSIFAFAGKRAGWGDVTLMAAVGAGFGVPRALAAVMLISLVGALVALFFILRRRRSASVRGADSTEGSRDGVDSGRSIPYGVAIALGAAWAMVWSGPSVSDEAVPVNEVVVGDGGTAESAGAVQEVDHDE